MTRAFIAILTAALLWGQSSRADTISFTGLAAGDLGTTASAGGVTFESATNLVNQSGQSDQSGQYFTSVGDAICASHGTGDNCTDTMTIKFNGKVNLGIYRKVTKIRLTYQGVEDGMAIGKFNFTRAAGKHAPDGKRRARAGSGGN